MEYEFYEADDHITVMPKGNCVDARKCKTFWKSEGWTMKEVKKFYEGDKEND